ncbi:hypothetical protein [Desulfotomaculum nigrificans]|uniref:hypothetical protein n=1 Tax=Desulfotomaculum nigrificans TaxID=1565 RepID=UPI0012FA7F1A|nr:hypothetical protein [Desulfotomaculum nigrificans]
MHERRPGAPKMGGQQGCVRFLRQIKDGLVAARHAQDPRSPAQPAAAGPAEI